MSVLIVAGVSSCGKTTIGREVAETSHAQFLDADDLHSPANVAKMSAGIPLTDEDRKPWLDTIRARIESALIAGHRLVIAASCLERSHRRHLVAESTPEQVKIAFLVVSFETAFERAQHRHHRFFPEELVRSQFDVLELPGPQEINVQSFDGEKSVAELVAEIVNYYMKSGS